MQSDIEFPDTDSGTSSTQILRFLDKPIKRVYIDAAENESVGIDGPVFGLGSSSPSSYKSDLKSKRLSFAAGVHEAYDVDCDDVGPWPPLNVRDSSLSFREQTSSSFIVSSQIENNNKEILEDEINNNNYENNNKEILEDEINNNNYENNNRDGKDQFSSSDDQNVPDVILASTSRLLNLDSPSNLTSQITSDSHLLQFPSSPSHEVFINQQGYSKSQSLKSSSTPKSKNNISNSNISTSYLLPDFQNSKTSLPVSSSSNIKNNKQLSTESKSVKSGFLSSGSKLRVSRNKYFFPPTVLHALCEYHESPPSLIQDSKTGQVHELDVRSHITQSSGSTGALANLNQLQNLIKEFVDQIVPIDFRSAVHVLDQTGILKRMEKKNGQKLRWLEFGSVGMIVYVVDKKTGRTYQSFVSMDAHLQVLNISPHPKCPPRVHDLLKTAHRIAVSEVDEILLFRSAAELVADSKINSRDVPRLVALKFRNQVEPLVLLFESLVVKETFVACFSLLRFCDSLASPIVTGSSRFEEDQGTMSASGTSKEIRLPVAIVDENDVVIGSTYLTVYEESSMTDAGSSSSFSSPRAADVGSPKRQRSSGSSIRERSASLPRHKLVLQSTSPSSEELPLTSSSSSMRPQKSESKVQTEQGATPIRLLPNPCLSVAQGLSSVPSKIAQGCVTGCESTCNLRRKLMCCGAPPGSVSGSGTFEVVSQTPTGRETSFREGEASPGTEAAQRSISSKQLSQSPRSTPTTPRTTSQGTPRSPMGSTAPVTPGVNSPRGFICPASKYEEAYGKWKESLKADPACSPTVKEADMPIINTVTITATRRRSEIKKPDSPKCQRDREITPRGNNNLGYLLPERLCLSPRYQFNSSAVRCPVVTCPLLVIPKREAIDMTSRSTWVAGTTPRDMVTPHSPIPRVRDIIPGKPIAPTVPLPKLAGYQDSIGWSMWGHPNLGCATVKVEDVLPPVPPRKPLRKVEPKKEEKPAEPEPEPCATVSKELYCPQLTEEQQETLIRKATGEQTVEEKAQEKVWRRAAYVIGSAQTDPTEEFPVPTHRLVSLRRVPTDEQPEAVRDISIESQRESQLMEERRKQGSAIGEPTVFDDQPEAQHSKMSMSLDKSVKRTDTLPEEPLQKEPLESPRPNYRKLGSAAEKENGNATREEGIRHQEPSMQREETLQREGSSPEASFDKSSVTSTITSQPSFTDFFVKDDASKERVTSKPSKKTTIQETQPKEEIMKGVSTKQFGEEPSVKEPVESRVSSSPVGATPSPPVKSLSDRVSANNRSYSGQLQKPFGSQGMIPNSSKKAIPSSVEVDLPGLATLSEMGSDLDSRLVLTGAAMSSQNVLPSVKSIVASIDLKTKSLETGSLASENTNSGGVSPSVDWSKVVREVVQNNGRNSSLVKSDNLPAVQENIPLSQTETNKQNDMHPVQLESLTSDVVSLSSFRQQVDVTGEDVLFSPNHLHTSSSIYYPTPFVMASSKDRTMMNLEMRSRWDQQARTKVLTSDTSITSSADLIPRKPTPPTFE